MKESLLILANVRQVDYKSDIYIFQNSRMMLLIVILALTCIGSSLAVECVDKNQNCSSWAVNWECKKNPNFMDVNCRKSCGKCDHVPCVNNNINCSMWAVKGECKANPKYMAINCGKACGICDNVECVNKNVSCSKWAVRGECKANPDYMVNNCRKACGICPGVACVNKNDSCSKWAVKGECKANPDYMVINCRKACGICSDECVNKNENCSRWALKGECTTNPNFMLDNCRKACGLCAEVAGLSFTADDYVINECLPLHLKCTLTAEGEKLSSSLQFMYIKHDQAGVIATVADGATITINPNVGLGQAKGEISEKLGSFIELAWKNPTRQQAGSYLCLAQFKKADGKEVVLTSNLSVEFEQCCDDVGGN
ncbi:putative tyrosinase-like protein tyr-3 isoform X2 [Biomphalaria glabrata]|uniref:Tyrosinase-like protein tyr-3 isoform X2 n=1 Tax=Biomphalaria glabrata TaxID=6526 RepID=A0A9W3AX98_BIOGL|nr:putative tyrosinase-like protein tyr-3 isoform X2 [Biomphalaria glabrata]